MKIYLIRHGETTSDIEDRYGGSYDDHMTEAGHKQIKAITNKLIGKDIEIVFSSSLLRAREAAEIIKKALNCPLEIIDGLKERNNGILAGLTKVEAQQKHPKAVALNADPKNTIPQGESYQDSYDRIIRAFNSIFSKDYKTVAIITHDGPIRYIHRELGRGELGELSFGDIFELEIT